MALLEDRERIARDLHDTVIQRLFATGLMLQGAIRHTQASDLRDRLTQAVDDLDLTVKHIRTAIFGLAASSTAVGGLRERILGLLSEASGPLGFDPQVLFDSPIDTVPADVGADAIAVLREALANVARHARAERVRVAVTADETFTLRVIDDGIGIDPERTTQGQGLPNLRDRARRHGGTLATARAPDSGTSLEWKVPLGDRGS